MSAAEAFLAAKDEGVDNGTVHLGVSHLRTASGSSSALVPVVIVALVIVIVSVTAPRG